MGVDTLLNSYTLKQEWLKLIYGKPQITEKNNVYNIYDYTWNLECCKIEHFIKDRFGDDEGIF